jgi:predicted RNA-binding Zn ribbon-like protein
LSTATEWVDEHFIAGDVAVDFANTVYRRTPEIGADLFNGIEALTTWLARVQLLPMTDHADGVIGLTVDALDEARALRAMLWTVFEAQANGHPLSGEALAGLLETARRGIARIVVESDGGMRPLATRGSFAILALRAMALVLNPPSQGVRTCDRCGWFFVDSSRGRRRRWCSMKTCGNQAKAARYRASRR